MKTPHHSQRAAKNHAANIAAAADSLVIFTEETTAGLFAEFIPALNFNGVIFDGVMITRAALDRKQAGAFLAKGHPANRSQVYFFTQLIKRNKATKPRTATTAAAAY